MYVTVIVVVTITTTTATGSATITFNTTTYVSMHGHRGSTVSHLVSLYGVSSRFHVVWYLILSHLVSMWYGVSSRFHVVWCLILSRSTVVSCLVPSHVIRLSSCVHVWQCNVVVFVSQYRVPSHIVSSHVMIVLCCLISSCYIIRDTRGREVAQ